MAMCSLSCGFQHTGSERNLLQKIILMVSIYAKPHPYTWCTTVCACIVWIFAHRAHPADPRMTIFTGKEKEEKEKPAYRWLLTSMFIYLPCSLWLLATFQAAITFFLQTVVLTNLLHPPPPTLTSNHSLPNDRSTGALPGLLQ